MLDIRVTFAILLSLCTVASHAVVVYDTYCNEHAEPKEWVFTGNNATGEFVVNVPTDQNLTNALERMPTTLAQIAVKIADMRLNSPASGVFDAIDLAPHKVRGAEGFEFATWEQRSLEFYYSVEVSFYKGCISRLSFGGSYYKNEKLLTFLYRRESVLAREP